MGEGTAAHDASVSAGAGARGATDEELQVTAASLVVECASADAFVALREAGISAVLLKGPPQQSWLARAGAPRASIDVDLLVDPADADAAGQVLAERGYRLTPEVTPGVGRHSFLWTAAGRVSVEIHDGLWGAEGHVWRVLEGQTEAIPLAGKTVEVPNEAARCLVAALHAAHHGDGDAAAKYDLERALAVASDASWSCAARLADEIDAEAAFAAGLGLVPAGVRLRGDLDLDEPTLTGGTALDIATPTSGAAGYYWFSQQHGFRERARFVLRKIAPPADFMRFKHPYARRGRAQLLLVYLYRPFWLARWAIPGLREWRRIRAATRSDRTNG
jgi:hypothetical protein